MYIQYVSLKNIRSIQSETIWFGENPAGWHVLIGENGTGKSTIVRAIALGIIGPRDVKALRLNLGDWISIGEKEANIELHILPHPEDSHATQTRKRKNPFVAKMKLTRENGSALVDHEVIRGVNPFNYIWSNKPGWFSSAFGPFRRFTGGDKEWDKVYYVEPRAAAHLSVFGEDIALTESLQWLRDLNNQRNEPRYEAHGKAALWLDKIKTLLNNGNWLPHGTQMKDVILDKIIFIDANQKEMDVNSLSDGFRSVLSLTFELLRQLVRAYGFERVFDNLEKNQYKIDLPGVVLIDEIDAHLHPTWQTEIGNWFIERFPALQFIVTTHSPLVCRAAEKGSIFKLGKPGSGEAIQPITGQAKDRLVFGNLLDAYGTDAFGEDVSQSASGLKLGERMALLSKKAFKGTISVQERTELAALKAKMPSVE